MPATESKPKFTHPVVGASAVLSPDGVYRYVLTRRLHSVLRWVRPMLFVMLNPSVADASIDDPTIRRCISFAVRGGCTSLTVVNLFAFRATDPSELMARNLDEITGPDNERHVREQVAAHITIGFVVVGWGEHAAARRATALRTYLASLRPWCLGTTKSGEPRHPLYLPTDQPLEPWPTR